MTPGAGIAPKGRGGAFRLEDGAVGIVRGRMSRQVPWEATEAVEDDGASARRVTGEDTADGFRVRGGASAVRASRAGLERPGAEVDAAHDRPRIFAAGRVPPP